MVLLDGPPSVHNPFWPKISPFKRFGGCFRVLKIVFFLVVGVFALCVVAGVAMVLLGTLAQVLSTLFAVFGQLFKWLRQIFFWARAKWLTLSPLRDSPTSMPPVASVDEQATCTGGQLEPPTEPLSAVPLEQTIQPTIILEPLPVAEVSDEVHGLTPSEEPKVDVPLIETPAIIPVEPASPVFIKEEPVSEKKNEPQPESPSTQSPPHVEPVVPPVIPRTPHAPHAPGSQQIPLRPKVSLPPARPMFPQLPDFVGIGRRRFRMMVERDPDGRPGMVIVCQLLGAFKDGWRGPIRLTVTAQEFSDGKHHPLIRLGNSDFDPANPDVIHEYPDGGRFGFREWTTVARINLNDFEGYGSGSSQLEVTCRGWELRDGGNNGDLIFEDTEVLRALLVTGGYYARKQRRVEQLKAVVVVLRLFVCLDGGERNITNRLNKHFEAVGARFMRRWVGRDIALRDLINSEFIRRLQGSRLPADIAASAKLSDAPKDLRDWLLLECADISEDFKPQTPDGEAVKQLAALTQQMGGP